MTDLHAEEMLLREFDYAAKTAEQAQDDRTAILNLYLLLVGGVGSLAIALPQINNNPGFALPRETTAVLFGLLGVTGFFVLMTLLRLRQAWQDSAFTMNRIKDFYVDRFPDIADAFRWRTKTLPPPGKPWTITFNLAFLVCILDSAALGVAVHFAEPLAWQANFYAEGFIGMMFFLWQLLFYFIQLPWHRT
ncbi:MAG: hypothetical protein HY868_00610 [Chloroflexi bacterium]|nr:hypothetical protein [Chloroflexota bacterium]